MNGALKHILFVTTDSDAVAVFNTYLNPNEVRVSNFTSGMGVIQYIKQIGEADLLILEEHIKPLGAVQTIHYLKDSINYSGEILILSDSGVSEIQTDEGTFEVLKKGFDKSDLDRVLNLLSENKEQIVELDSKPYSLSYLSNLSDGDEAFIYESLKIFNESVGQCVTEIENLFQQGNYKEVSNLAHNIKPSFEMLENSLGSTICDQLAHSPVDSSKAEQVELLKKEYLKVQEYLKQDFPDLFKTI
ncbi:Hpt domain-containing protein [Leeuwenhoekiella marinoflava]|uniref:Hpt domain-containing protein n=2 Tax=Leeuwenhoekiella marinoflava TaxID=988 RepID=A0A4Q0PLZ7_9FLAO|nr:hypothetical protein [Leeuwenhoekiella marinoflava]RXG30718.1 hypothetical protein DSL99_1761 [Leeuwenhoekiella marinoflava]SHF18699.1 hypothetical protein SAMN02745246_01898 [Leeuwenhoekiella marinoflava DSM 3653]